MLEKHHFIKPRKTYILLNSKSKMESPKVVDHISECFIKPKYEVEASKEPFYLTPMDLLMFSLHYIQKGLLFKKPVEFSASKFLETLKNSLSLALVHFYPLAGQLVTHVDETRHESLIFIDPNKGQGARFIHASLDVTVSDILSQTDVPLVVQSFFDHYRAVNHDGHSRPLLSVQITELIDGIFVGCSMNHVLVDGTSYWHFWNVWSEIHQFKSKSNTGTLSMLPPPVYNRWFPEGHGPKITLPFTSSDEFVTRYEAPEFRDRIFHFSAESLARLKSRANQESNTTKISSFQSLSALCWRAITRANNLPLDLITNCKFAINNRHRLSPPLEKEYFGNCISVMKTSALVFDLNEHDLGWAASLLHQSVVNHSHKDVEALVSGWVASPYVYQMASVVDPKNLMIGSSPRFNMYENVFGFGKAVAVRSGHDNKCVGKVICYPGYEGGGSIDFEICLSPDAMVLLESDEEFMGVVSLPYNVH